MHIQFRIDDLFPLTNVEVKRLLQEVGKIMRAVKDNQFELYAKYNPDVFHILNRLHKWEVTVNELSHTGEKIPTT